MIDLANLTVPLIAAPMAGGPSTPALVSALAQAGGLGFLAAGYQSPAALDAQIGALAGGIDFGVNVFVPGPSLRDRTAVLAYRETLRPQAQRYGVELPDLVESDDDAFDAKIALLIERQVPLVSFTFGIPSAPVIDALKAAGAAVMITVADVDDASAAVAAGADMLCVQGTEAGGHRATFTIDAEPNNTATLDLLAQVVGRADVRAAGVSVVAAGGLADGRRVAQALDIGAVAVQIGTVLLDSDEAGTKPAYRAALHDSRFSETVVTRAFSGRPARGLRNRFTDTYPHNAPAEYPTVHHLTSPLRAAAAAADDADGMNLWCSSEIAEVPRGPAAEVVAGLWAAARATGLDNAVTR